MGSRLLPLAFAAAAMVADGSGLHRLAFYLVLVAIPGAAAAAFVAVSDVLDRKPARLRCGSSTGALVLLVVSSAARADAVGGVPAVAVSALVAAIVLYGLPTAVWLLEPLVPRPRARQVRARTQSAL